MFRFALGLFLVGLFIFVIILAQGIGQSVGGGLVEPFVR